MLDYVDTSVLEKYSESFFKVDSFRSQFYRGP